MFSWPVNYDSCYTLAGVISREGVGLHSGEKTRITISSYEKEGYYVSFKDKPNAIFKLTQDLIGSTMLCTAVKLGGRNLYTIEHLLSSMAGCGLSYIHIEVDGKEIPLLDGSAIQWVRDFEEVGIKKAPKPDNFFREINKSIILNKEGSVIAATPSEKTTIISTISFSYKAIGDQTFVIDLNPKSFVEGTVEYRFPVWKMISGALFVDAGSDLGSQNDVPGKPGKLLQKSGSGYSLGGGIGVKTPIGPLRLDVASKDLSGDWRYTLGVGWKF